MSNPLNVTLGANFEAQNDASPNPTNLLVNIPEPGTYKVSVVGWFNGPNRAAKFNFGGDATVTEALMQWRIYDINNSTLQFTAKRFFVTQLVSPFALDTVPECAFEANGVVTFSSAGTFMLRMAQTAPDEKPTILEAGTSMELTLSEVV